MLYSLSIFHGEKTVNRVCVRVRALARVRACACVCEQYRACVRALLSVCMGVGIGKKERERRVLGCSSILVMHAGGRKTNYARRQWQTQIVIGRFLIKHSPERQLRRLIMQLETKLQSRHASRALQQPRYYCATALLSTV